MPGCSREQIRAARMAALEPLLRKRGLELIERDAHNLELPACKGLLVKDSHLAGTEQGRQRH